MLRYLKWLLLPALCVVLAPFTPYLDLAISKAFFEDGHFFNNGFTAFLYKYGELVGFGFGGFACTVYLFSKRWRKHALVLILTGLLGTGLIVNAVLKDHWGRPRPKQLAEFGGKHAYRPFYQPNFHPEERQKSFPSGHVAVGFYYLALCVVARRVESRWLFWVGVFLTAFWGGGLFFARLAQGGHFFSDALFSILIMWEVALFFDWLIFDKLTKKVT